MKEAYCSYEIAKLLKEKGFDEPTWTRYEDNNEVIFGDKYNWNNSPMGQISAPTHQMAMKWLREVHNLNINNDLSIHGYFCSISHIVRDSSGHIVDVEDSESWETAYFDTHEKAIEESLKYSLENLI